jgi:iron complex transport system substrate-binding protein
MDESQNIRIVSLLSSATEIAFELGLGPQLVGVSHECDFPSQIKGLPVVSETKINPLDSAGVINQSVQDLVRQGLSIYQVKADLLEQLSPDLILTQNQCDVCAVSLADVESAVQKLTKKNTKICSLFPFALDDLCKDFRKVGELTGHQEEAEELVTRFWIRLNQVNAKAGTHLKYRPKVLALEWLDPPIVAGSWLPELITLAGGDPLIVDGPKPFKKVAWEELQSLNPDAVVVFPCGWSLERTLQEMNSEKVKNELLKLPQSVQDKIFACDGNQFFNRPGPRIADSLEMLGAILWPDKFPQEVVRFKNRFYQRWRTP